MEFSKSSVPGTRTDGEDQLSEAEKRDIRRANGKKRLNARGYQRSRGFLYFSGCFYAHGRMRERRPSQMSSYSELVDGQGA